MYKPTDDRIKGSAVGKTNEKDIKLTVTLNIPLPNKKHYQIPLECTLNK